MYAWGVHCMCHTTACGWRSEDSVWSPVLFLHQSCITSVAINILPCQCASTEKGFKAKWLYWVMFVCLLAFLNNIDDESQFPQRGQEAENASSPRTLVLCYEKSQSLAHTFCALSHDFLAPETALLRPQEELLVPHAGSGANPVPAPLLGLRCWFPIYDDSSVGWQMTSYLEQYLSALTLPWYLVNNSMFLK